MSPSRSRRLGAHCRKARPSVVEGVWRLDCSPLPNNASGKPACATGLGRSPRCAERDRLRFDQPFGDQPALDQLVVPRRLAAGKRVRQALDEQLRLEGAALRARVHRRQPERRQLELGENDAAAGLAESRRRPPRWAGTRVRRARSRSRAAGAPSCSSAWASDRAWSARRALRPPVKHPAVARRIAGIQAEPVAEEVARMLRRAPAAQVVGRRAEHAPHRKQRRDTSSSDAAGKICNATSKPAFTGSITASLTNRSSTTSG